MNTTICTCVYTAPALRKHMCLQYAGMVCQESSQWWGRLRILPIVYWNVL